MNSCRQAAAARLAVPNMAGKHKKLQHVGSGFLNGTTRSPDCVVALAVLRWCSAARYSPLDRAVRVLYCHHLGTDAIPKWRPARPLTNYCPSNWVSCVHKKAKTASETGTWNSDLCICSHTMCWRTKTVFWFCIVEPDSTSKCQRQSSLLELAWPSLACPSFRWLHELVWTRTKQFCVPQLWDGFSEALCDH